MVSAKNSRRGKKKRKKPRSASAAVPVFVVSDDQEIETRLIDAWNGSRGGAWASRGFDFQHTVAAWLAARLVAGDLHASALVPEGLEDITVESEVSRQVQVKSRGEHLGAFPVGKASKDVIDAWIRHRERGRGLDCLTVVFERGIKGESALSEFDRPLRESLGQDSKLRAAITVAAKERRLGESDLEEMLDRTTVFGISWSSLDHDSRSFLGTAFEKLRPAALDYLGRELRTIMAESAKANAPVNYGERQSLSRNELLLRSQNFIEQVDLEALESALTLGLCSTFSFTDELHDDRFYEGVVTQPGHVAAGLVVPRAELIGEAVTGVRETSSVILTGPSGVGKSALLWSIPHALPGVLWFRVNRLSSADVPEVLRLCRSYQVSDANPIGLLIDAAGTGQFNGWSRLREEAAATPGLFIISTARHEDLISLGDLSGCATISVTLDEAAAEAIFNGLRDRNATDLPHWRESFEQAEGLTLEFTHLLTRGERLTAVIGDQVRRRISERRNTELDLLSLSTTADRWSATLPVDKAAEACGVPQIELREPLARLAEEHLLVERNGTISGVHELRSIAISNAIHSQPPPVLDHTVSRLLPLLDPEQIRRFIPNALRDEPRLDQLIQSSAMREHNDIAKLTAYLRGLRLFDFYERAVNWTSIATRHGVPPALQPVAQFCAIAGTVLPDFFPEEFNQAVLDMGAAPESSRGASLIAAIGAQQLAEVLVSANDVDLANELLFEFQGSTISVVAEVQAVLTPSTPLWGAMKQASTMQIANILSTTNSLDPNLAEIFVESFGGESAIEAKIRKADPWILELRIDESSDEAVAYARILHISDSTHGDPHDRVIALGRLLLRCFPRTSHVDIKLVLPGGHNYQFGKHEIGSTNLRREYDHSELKVSWNQARMHVTNTVLGATDTERLSVALPLLETLSDLTSVIGNAFVTADVGDIDTNELGDQVNALGDNANQIGPRLRGRARAIDANTKQGSGSLMIDPLSSLVTDLTNNVFLRLTKMDNPTALAGFLSDQVIAKSLKLTQEEPWHLLGYDTFPDSLKSLETDLHDLLAVVAALAADASVKESLVRAARSGRRDGSLKRAADTARRRTKKRLQIRKDELEQIGRENGHKFKVYMPRDDRFQLVPERLISIEVQSLIHWAKALDEISAILQRTKMPEEIFVLVPFRSGKPVESLTMSLIESLIPTGSLGQWARTLPQTHETHLAQDFDDAIASIQVASGILALPEPQRSHDSVSIVLDTAMQKLAQAKVNIRHIPADSVTEQVLLFIDALENGIADEETGESVGGSIASQMLMAVTRGEQADLMTTMAAIRLMTLEWDIDPGNAANLFETDAL